MFRVLRRQFDKYVTSCLGIKIRPSNSNNKILVSLSTLLFAEATLNRTLSASIGGVAAKMVSSTPVLIS